MSSQPGPRSPDSVVPKGADHNARHRRPSSNKTDGAAASDGEENKKPKGRAKPRAAALSPATAAAAAPLAQPPPAPAGILALDAMQSALEVEGLPPLRHSYRAPTSSSTQSAERSSPSRALFGSASSLSSLTETEERTSSSGAKHLLEGAPSFAQQGWAHGGRPLAAAPTGAAPGKRDAAAAERHSSPGKPRGESGSPQKGGGSSTSEGAKGRSKSPTRRTSAGRSSARQTPRQLQEELAEVAELRALLGRS